jgi:hypothetical protein
MLQFLNEETVMNIDYPGNASASSRLRRALPAGRDGATQTVVSRIAVWLVEGLRAAAWQPVLTLGVLLLCADFITASELLPLLRPVAVLLAPLAIGMLMVVQDGASQGRPVPLREAIARLMRHSNALCAIGFYAVAMVAIGYITLLATFHVSLDVSLTANGARHLSINYSNNGAPCFMEALLGALMFAVTIAATCFAPALVILHDMPAYDALVTSLKIALRNWPSMIAYFVVPATIMLCASAIPLALRAFVLTPFLTAVPLLSIIGACEDMLVRSANGVKKNGGNNTLSI